MFSINSFNFMEYFLPQKGKNTDQQGNTGGGWWFKSHLQHLLYPCIQTILEQNRIEYLFPSTNLENELIFNESSKCALIYKVHGLENSLYPEFRGPEGGVIVRERDVETSTEGGGLVYGGSDSSIEGETCLQRRGLVYRGQNSATDRKACLRRWRLV